MGLLRHPPPLVFFSFFFFFHPLVQPSAASCAEPYVTVRRRCLARPTLRGWRGVSSGGRPAAGHGLQRSSTWPAPRKPAMRLLRPASRRC
jgi:hypothetical protein